MQEFEVEGALCLKIFGTVLRKHLNGTLPY